MPIDFKPLEKEVSKFLAENTSKGKPGPDAWNYYLGKAKSVLSQPLPNDPERRRIRLELAARWLDRAIKTLPK